MSPQTLQLRTRLIRALRTVRGQLAAIGLLFFGAALVATALATQRSWVESTFSDTMKPLPAHLREAAAAADRGDNDTINQLAPSALVLLYEDWMERPKAPRAAAAVLCQANPKALLARAEQTLVCGSPQQRLKALVFVEHCDSPEADPLLRRVERWAHRTRLTRLASAAQRVRHQASPHHSTTPGGDAQPERSAP